MSLITRCPACGTRFRVVPDQLKISDGWVRCGQCNEIFDAQAQLAGGGAPIVAPPADPPPQPGFAAPGSTEPVTPPPAFADTTVDDEPEYGPPALDPVADDLSAPVGDAAPEPDLQWTTPLEPIAAVSGEPALPDSPAVPSQRVEPVLEAAAGSGEAVELPRDAVSAQDQEPERDQEPEPEPEPEPAQPPPLDDVSFVRQARRRAFWRRPWIRVMMALLACLLALGLAVQVSVQQRDTLAQRAPQLRPVLEALCQPLGCRVGPPRRIEAVAIDNSNFSRVRPDAYRLAVTLSNQSPTAVAMPALELTLTDSQDQALLRRVIAPAELGQGATGVIGANAEWSATLTVAVTPDATTSRIVGYRLLAFYP